MIPARSAALEHLSGVQGMDGPSVSGRGPPEGGCGQNWPPHRTAEPLRGALYFDQSFQGQYTSLYAYPAGHRPWRGPGPDGVPTHLQHRSSLSHFLAARLEYRRAQLRYHAAPGHAGGGPALLSARLAANHRPGPRIRSEERRV